MSHFFNYLLPLWAFILLWAGLTLGIAWFAWLAATERKDRVEADKLLRKVDEALEVGPAELQELNHDYATLGLMVEDQHNQILDLEQRLSRLEQRSTHIHIGISKLFQVCDDDDDYTGPDDGDEDGDVVTLPHPLPDWVNSVEGLDTL